MDIKRIRKLTNSLSLEDAETSGRCHKTKSKGRYGKKVTRTSRTFIHTNSPVHQKTDSWTGYVVPRSCHSANMCDGCGGVLRLKVNVSYPFRGISVFRQFREFTTVNYRQ